MLKPFTHIFENNLSESGDKDFFGDLSESFG